MFRPIREEHAADYTPPPEGERPTNRRVFDYDPTARAVRVRVGGRELTFPLEELSAVGGSLQSAE